jgi:hypothetical protein
VHIYNHAINRDGLENRHFIDLYHRTCSHVQDYFASKQNIINRKRKYRAQFAEFNQRKHMLLQRALPPITIDIKELADALMKWPNIWGFSADIDSSNGSLHLRIGFCNLSMQESAEESCYDYPAEIKLYPFFVTMVIYEDGRIHFPSRDDLAVGLATKGETRPNYYFHPHQLSDQPCFGSFGQLIKQSSSQGDFLTTISLLSSFYSQYNSNDSAGENAYTFHPSHFELPRTIDNFPERYINSMKVDQYYVIDTDKLHAAAADYISYYKATIESGEPAPQLTDSIYCEYCEENTVNDNDEYYISAHGSRICGVCWNDHYCSNCERHTEDCVCQDE